MSARRTTIYLPIEAELALGLRDGDSMSARIATVALRYERMWLDASPVVSEAEWSALCEVFNGVWLSDDPNGAPTSTMWAEVADAKELGDKWRVDQDALVQRVRRATNAERVAIVEVVRRFWADTETPVRQALDRAGARLSD